MPLKYVSMFSHIMHCYGGPCNGQSILLYAKSQWKETRLLFFMSLALLIRRTTKAEGERGSGGT